MPLVSVVTPIFNSRSTIQETIASIRSQSLEDWEVLVVDDGSTDGSIEAVQAISVGDDRIRLLENQFARGPAGARNTAIKAARGRYIAFLDSDDRWMPQKLESQIAFMQKDNVAFSYGDYLAIDADSGRELGVVRAPGSLTYQDLLRSCPIGCLTVAFDQQVLGKMYMPDVRRGQDWGLWLRLTKDGAVARRYPGLEALYTYGGDSLSSGKFAKVSDVYRIYHQYEGLSALRSVRYMIPHMWSALTKRPDKLTPEERLSSERSGLAKMPR